MAYSQEVNHARDKPIPMILGSPVRGRRIVIRCPMPDHKDSTPSFSIYPDNSFHCYGCGAHGKGAIDYVMMVSGCTFAEAVEYINGRLDK